MATPANTAANANSLISALRGNTGPMTNNSGVTFWQFDYNGQPLAPRTPTTPGANNPNVLELPTDLPPTPETPVTPDPIEQPIQVDVPIVDIPAPDLDSEPDPDPPVEPDEPAIVTPIVPVTPDPEDPPKTGTVTIEDFTPDSDVVELGGGEGDGDPADEDTTEEKPKTGTVTIEDFTPIDPPTDDIEEILDDMDWGDTTVADEVIELGGGEGDGDPPKVGTVTIEDFTLENPAVIPNNDSPVIRDILNEQINDPVGTVTIEPVSDNVDVGIIDAADNDPFGWDEWLDPVAEDPIIITAADNDPFGWDQYEDPAGGDDVVPVTPTEEELEELEQLMLLMDAL